MCYSCVFNVGNIYWCPHYAKTFSPDSAPKNFRGHVERGGTNALLTSMTPGPTLLVSRDKWRIGGLSSAKRKSWIRRCTICCFCFQPTLTCKIELIKMQFLCFSFFPFLFIQTGTCSANCRVITGILGSPYHVSSRLASGEELLLQQ